MTMKVMSAKEAKNAFGIFVDTAQVEPVLVTKRSRPVGVFLSIQEIKKVPELRKSLVSHLDNEHDSEDSFSMMWGANKAHRVFQTPDEADQFIQELRNEWK